MLEDYCNRLQQLNKQKSEFLKLKYKTNHKVHIENQQNKYHKYILSQIAYKNRLDSLFKFHQIFNQITCQQKRHALNKLIQNQQRKSTQKYNHVLNNQQNDKKEITQKILQKGVFQCNKNLKQKIEKISCNLFQAWIAKIKQKNLKCSFQLISRKYKVIQNVQKFSQLINGKILFQKNVFFQNLKHKNLKTISKNQYENRQSKSFIFSLNEFSQIIPYTIEQQSQQLSTTRIKNIEQIDSKFKPTSESKISSPQILEQQQNQYKLMIQSFQKLKQQVVIMKNLLCQKNKQIKLKDQQIYKIKKDYQKKIQILHDQISQKIQKEYQLKDSVVSRFSKKNIDKSEKVNDSYLKQLQQHIIGDRSPRGNQHEEDPVSYQLLQKYMKESFQMRQKMDMARQMCQQFEFDTRTGQGQIMIQIIKLLTPQQRLNAFVD